MNKMKILSWNVHYDVTAAKKQHLEELKKEEGFDLLILQECTPKGFDLLKNDWKHSILYADTLYENKANYGIAVFSNDYELRFTENFNRNFRYVLPFEVWKDKSFLFYLFAVWTKTVPFSYSKNVLNALQFGGYQKYIADKALFIGDFNTPTTPQKQAEYDALQTAGLINCAAPEDVPKPTYSHKETVDYFTADYCFATSQMKASYTIQEKLLDLDDSIAGKDKYKGLSDHVPVIVEIEL